MVNMIRFHKLFHADKIFLFTEGKRKKKKDFTCFGNYTPDLPASAVESSAAERRGEDNDGQRSVFVDSLSDWLRNTLFFFKEVMCALILQSFAQFAKTSERTDLIHL